MRNPFAVLIVKVCRIQQVAKAVFRGLRNRGLALSIEQEERITLSRNGKTVQLPCQRLNRLAAIWKAFGSSRTLNEAAVLRGNDGHRIGVFHRVRSTAPG